MKILILGCSGMLGNAMYRYLSLDKSLKVKGTIRSSLNIEYLDFNKTNDILTHVDVVNLDLLIKVFGQVKPDIVINCVGLIKQLAITKDPLQAVLINSLLPHRLAHLCSVSEARLIHISTDCVFSGKKGNYLETDFADADDLYGRTKLLGEVDYPHAITLRTSIIGHESNGNRSLINWFLAQKGSVKGFTQAIFSGLPTIELAKVVHQYILPNPNLKGLYHLAVKPINKFDLLNWVKKIYNQNIEIIPCSDLVVDRSLDSHRFYKASGYNPPCWEHLIQNMHQFQ